jgi:ATP-dependent Lon protease
VTIRAETLRHVIDRYSREAGVRGLENQIKRIMRKAAVRLASDPEATIVVTPEDVESLLGRPVFTPDEIFGSTAGVVTGLAWTSMGGATLQIEATAVASKSPGFKQTGQLGDVMQESASIAYTYVMAHLEAYGASKSFFEEHVVHLHVPAGATPKDGPSAGITMATALVSMVRRRPVRRALAMTGELTLTGHVLPIGGVKEKVIAARRAAIKTLVFPAANQKDFDELPEYLRRGLKAHFVERFEHVLEIAFPERES